MDQQPTIGTRPPWQFIVGRLLLAALLAALSYAAAKLQLTLLNDRVGPHDPMALFLSFFAVPTFACGAVGALRGNVRSWLGYGFVIAFAVAAIGLLLAPLHLNCHRHHEPLPDRGFACRSSQ